MYRRLYNKLVNQCVNRELMSVYNLSGYSSIEYCVVEDSSIPIDGLDIGFLTITGMILMIVLSSTLYDRHLKNCNIERSGDHYKNTLDGKCKLNYIVDWKILVIIKIFSQKLSDNFFNKEKLVRTFSKYQR